MTWAPGPVVTRRRLGGELRRLRDQSRLKLEDVARALECSPSKISRLENGKGLPRWRDVRDLLDVYGVGEGETRDRLLQWAQTGQQPMWWAKYADVLPPGMSPYVELEWDASELCAFESYVVHGLLQTADYAHTVLRAAWAGTHDEAAIERLVEVRMKRQDALLAEHGLRFTCILDESTLYRVVGSPAVQKAQLEHLVAVAEAEHVEIRVLPFAAGLVWSGNDPFCVLEFAEDLEQVFAYVERYPNDSALIAEPAAVESYRRQWAALHAASCSESESILLMAQASRRLSPF